MSRAIIGGVVATVILALTAVTYFVAGSGLEDRIHADVNSRIDRAQRLLVQNASLEGLGLLKRVEALAAEDDLLKALKAESTNEAQSVANLSFGKFLANEPEPKPDILAIVNASGDLVAMYDVPNPVPGDWKKDGELIYPAIDLALDKRIVTSEPWVYQNRGLMKVGVAPIVDMEADTGGGEPGVVVGAVVLAYSMTAREAQRQHALLDTYVAYFHGERIFATSFRRTAQSNEENTETQALLKAKLDTSGLGKAALETGFAGRIESLEISGADYRATAGRLPRFSSKPLPADYPPAATGAMVLMSVDEQTSQVGSIKILILVLGIGALVFALIGMMLTSRRILHQADDLEVGINEIINGNLDRSFRPVGNELDGLASALNVMLARLLGRPEPGEEEYDEDGNIIQPGAVDFDTTGVSEKDAAALNLAAEPEPDYYKRIFGEYISAREKLGIANDGVAFENFVTKLRFNETNLKSQYESRAVRFRVVVTDGKVTLKPVPIV